MAFYIKKNDTSPAVSATLADYNNDAANLTGATVRIHMEDLSGVIKVDAECVIQSAVNGVVVYNWQVGDTDTVGTYNVEFEVTYSDGTIETYPNNGYETVVVVGELN